MIRLGLGQTFVNARRIGVGDRFLLLTRILFTLQHPSVLFLLQRAILRALLVLFEHVFASSRQRALRHGTIDMNRIV